MTDSSPAASPRRGGGPDSATGVRFGVFEVDFEAAELRKRGLRVRLQEQPFRVLSLLLEQPGRVVTREELQSKLWAGDTFVDFDHGLNTAVNKIRQALGDSASNPRFIETMHRRGYRFIAPVERVGGAADAMEPVRPVDEPSSTVAAAAEPAEAPATPAEDASTGTPAWQQSDQPQGPGGELPAAFRPWLRVGGIVVFAVSIALVILLAGTLFDMVRQRFDGAFVGEPERVTPAVVNRVRILAAQSSDYVSPADQHWSRDRFFVGGETTRREGVVVGAKDTNLFLGERYGRFQYVIPVMPGEYRLTMHFAETWFGPGNQGGGGPGSRRFDVESNGTYLLRDFDVYREAGGANRAIVRSFDGINPNEQGHVVITFLPKANNAMINALELTPASNGRGSDAIPAVPQVPDTPNTR